MSDEKQVRQIEPILILGPDEMRAIFENPPPIAARVAEEGEEPSPDDFVMWVIHNRLTRDFPGVYVMRRHWVHRAPDGAINVADPRALCHHDLEPLRAQLPPGLHHRPHQPGEDFTIEETWF